MICFQAGWGAISRQNGNQLQQLVLEGLYLQECIERVGSLEFWYWKVIVSDTGAPQVSWDTCTSRRVPDAGDKPIGHISLSMFRGRGVSAVSKFLTSWLYFFAFFSRYILYIIYNIARQKCFCDVCNFLNWYLLYFSMLMKSSVDLK